MVRIPQPFPLARVYPDGVGDSPQIQVLEFLVIVVCREGDERVIEIPVAVGEALAYGDFLGVDVCWYRTPALMGRWKKELQGL